MLACIWKTENAFTVDLNTNWHAIMEYNMSSGPQLKTKWPYDPAIPLTEINAKYITSSKKFLHLHNNCSITKIERKTI